MSTNNLGMSDRPRFLSESDCREIIQRLERFSEGGGYTTVAIWSSWTGNVRWARNQVSTSGEVRNNTIMVSRNLNGASSGTVMINETSDEALVAASRRAEWMARQEWEVPQSDLITRQPLEKFTPPPIFSEATYQLDAGRRAAAARELAKSAVAAGMLSAGYIEVAARSVAALDTLGRVRYFPFTQAQYSVTVRDPKGTGSGWAGMDHYDWSKIDGERISQVALEKCLKSRAPVAIEPGRYTTILEPQAVADFAVGVVKVVEWNPFQVDYFSREWAEGEERIDGQLSPYYKTVRPNGWFPTLADAGYSKLGERIVDKRITITSDPMDPELGAQPLNLWDGNGTWINNTPIYHPTTWIKDGVITNMSYGRRYATRRLGLATALPNSGAFRMSGGDTSIDEMISTTKRGLLVTRFDRVLKLDLASILMHGTTRDGLWLIENGKISKPVKNLAFTESVLRALNNVDQLGVPQRVFHPPKPPMFFVQPTPYIVPPLKIRDFSFTALDDAV